MVYNLYPPISCVCTYLKCKFIKDKRATLNKTELKNKRLQYNNEEETTNQQQKIINNYSNQ